MLKDCKDKNAKQQPFWETRRREEFSCKGNAKFINHPEQ
jgi:hypothetical protein